MDVNRLDLQFEILRCLHTADLYFPLLMLSSTTHPRIRGHPDHLLQRFNSRHQPLNSIG